MRTWIGIALLAAGTAHAQDDFRVHTLPGNREQASYVLGQNNQHWQSSRYLWYYNPANQPANLNTQAVVATIQHAAARWSGMCGVSFDYLGLTTARPYMGNDAAAVDRVNVIGWDALAGDLSDAGAITASWSTRDAVIDADIAFNTVVTTPWNLESVDGVITHELGHAIGVKHSNVPESVMFANPYHSYNYLRALRGDDANACAALYGAASTAESDRAFNWAEEAYPEHLSPRFAQSGYYMGYYYRFYPSTQSYLGTKAGVVYYMGADGMMYSMGTLGDYRKWIDSWGY
jgi:hypothetical protein